MSKKILTIGFELASDVADIEQFVSKVSLLDWDIILFKPSIRHFLRYGGDTYNGKPCLSDDDSFKVRESCEHWRRELKQAIDTGKTVIVFLSTVQEIFIATGSHEYSGTGRNRAKTRHVAAYSNYYSLPVSQDLVTATGRAMKLTSIGEKLLAPYWDKFQSVSEYNVFLSPETKGVCLTTKSGDKPVGAILSSKNSSGSLVLLPDIDFKSDNFIVIEEKTGRERWTPAARQFAAQLVGAVVALDKALHSSAEVTPEPDWATDLTYSLAIERTLRSDLLDAERKVEEAQRRKEAIQERLKDAARLRALLYEKGKPLEGAIIEALRLLGFEAAQYKENDSEFDVVFNCAEGRLLGEAEGKDTKPVTVDKLRQLAMNIHEDLQREEVNSPAKGVLFGNGYRLSPPENRNTQFTEKCIAASQSSSTALLATSDLYTAARYLSDQADEAYAKLCRAVILAGVGPTTLPPPPAVVTNSSTNVSE